MNSQIDATLQNYFARFFKLTEVRVDGRFLYDTWTEVMKSVHLGSSFDKLFDVDQCRRKMTSSESTWEWKMVDNFEFRSWKKLERKSETFFIASIDCSVSLAEGFGISAGTVDWIPVLD